MALLFDYHIHIEDGPYQMEYIYEYLEVAKGRCIQEIGISEHAYNFVECTDIWPASWERGSRRLEDYVNLILEAKRSGLPVKMGIEMDYAPGKEHEIRDILSAYQWDYVIGSVHHLGDWGFDDPSQENLWNLVDVGEAYEEYFLSVRKASESGLFDILAHLDVIKIFGHKPKYALHRDYVLLAESIAQSGCSIEINTAGLRKPVGEIYPNLGLLKACVQRGVGVVISSDAHQPGDVGRDFRIALEHARLAGVEHLTAFDGRQRFTVPL